MYFAVKHTHLTLVLLSLVFFYFRFFRIQVQGHTPSKWLKVAPHVIDTLLLVSAIALCFILGQYPIQTAWLTTKVLLVAGYIGFAIMAMRSKAKVQSYAFLAGATLCVLFAGKVAVSKSLM